MEERVRYRILRAAVEDRARILQFMRQHFYKYEPLNMSLGLPEGPHCSDMIFSLTSLHEGRSLMAVEDTDDGSEDIIGICLNGEVTPHQDGECVEDLVSKCPCPKYVKVLEFLVKVEKDGRVWKSTGLDKMFDIHALAVDANRRRDGLGRALVEHSFRLAKEQGYPAVSMYCTSHYSACLAEKLGMRCEFVLRYDEYLDKNGDPVFKPPSPHVALKCYVHVIG